ncbi:Plasmodium vivax Vir protein, putative [Plasmodium vivax]|uniref:Vir protein, putative n=1 Tax=Plasmodium vivax TaxID=5855 RepID=A0A1G4E9Y4_PLAVI|nr:Plasmodium vivax Vir protein, putative [Plasmodium vivax]
MNLKYLNTKEKDDQSVIDDCEILQYWMNDHVINVLKRTKYNEYIERIYKLIVAWYMINKTLDQSKYICKPTGGPLISLRVKEFEFRKEMYDYYYNYPKIKDWKFSNKNDCSETCKYLISINENYENYKSACSHSDNNKCVYKFKNFDKYHPKHLIVQLGCKPQSECNRNNALARDENLQGTPVADVEVQEERVQDNTQSSTENNNSRTILNVALPASVFFVLFPILYKMTPLGSRFGKANKIRNNIINDLKYEEGDSFLTHPFEQENMKNSDKTYNISYNNT